MNRIFLLIWLLSACGRADKQEASNGSLSPAQFKERISVGTVLLDVRTPGEYSTGIISGAVNLDFRAADFGQRLDSLDKSRTYLVYCASGARSGKAADLMRAKSFGHVGTLKGGVEAWVASGFLLE